jgi:hypothetical protein
VVSIFDQLFEDHAVIVRYPVGHAEMVWVHIYYV